jgi:hypothetical protein
MKADDVQPSEGPKPARDVTQLTMVPAHATTRDNELPLDNLSSASAAAIAQKSDTRRSPSEGGPVWKMDQLQEARREKTPPRKEEVIEAQFSIPLILQDDELLEAQQSIVSAPTLGDLARTTGGHDELMYDQVGPLS